MPYKIPRYKWRTFALVEDRSVGTLLNQPFGPMTITGQCRPAGPPDVPIFGHFRSTRQDRTAITRLSVALTAFRCPGWDAPARETRRSSAPGRPRAGRSVPNGKNKRSFRVSRPRRRTIQFFARDCRPRPGLTSCAKWQHMRASLKRRPWLRETWLSSWHFVEHGKDTIKKSFRTNANRCKHVTTNCIVL